MRAHARTDEGGGGPPGDGPALRHHHSQLVEGQAQGLLSRGPGGRAPRVTALEGKSLLRDSLFLFLFCGLPNTARSPRPVQSLFP